MSCVIASGLDYEEEQVSAPTVGEDSGELVEESPRIWQIYNKERLYVTADRSSSANTTTAQGNDDLWPPFILYSQQNAERTYNSGPPFKSISTVCVPFYTYCVCINYYLEGRTSMVGTFTIGPGS